MSFTTHPAELGPQYAEFRINRPLFIAMLALPSILGLVVAIANAWLLHTDPRLTLFAAVTACIAAVLALISYYTSVIHALIYQDGVNITHRFGSDLIAWHSIEWVQGVDGFRGMRIKQEGERSFTLRPRWLQLFRVGLPPSSLISIDAEDLLGAIAEGSIPYRSRALISKLEQGQTLTFPPLSVTAQGVQTPDQMLAWTDIKDSIFSSDTIALWIYHSNQQPSARAVELELSPNVDVLPVLLNHFNPNIGDGKTIEQQLFQEIEVRRIQQPLGRRLLRSVGHILIIVAMVISINMLFGLFYKSDRTLRSEGEAALIRNDGAAAVSAYQELLERYPDDATLYMNRGRGYAISAEYDQALADYTRALELRPNYASTIYYLGRLYHRQQQYDTALHYYARSEEEHVRQNATASVFFARTFYQRALIYIEQGQREQAIEQLQLGQRYAHDELTIELLRDAFASLQEGR